MGKPAPPDERLVPALVRVVVVGPPGSGKTTVARRLAAKLAAPHVELDSLWWDPNWTEAGEAAFAERLLPIVDGERWVLDGNYVSSGARDVIWPRADTIVWLDFARWVTVPRVVRRTIRRGAFRTVLWSGNREPLRLALRPDSIIRYAWREHPKYNRRYEGLDDDAGLAHLTWVRLRSPAEVRRWLSSLDTAPTR
jgi:adenylate kinase family enzyme